jgi:hypothetical protein
MIDRIKKHKEKSKLSDKFEQPFNKSDCTLTILGIGNTLYLTSIKKTKINGTIGTARTAQRSGLCQA